jgi:hypothetical protein
LKDALDMNRIYKAAGLFASAMFTLGAHAAEPMFNAEPAPKWSIEWGWNNETYAKSDIHFKGIGHDFTLYGVRASDTQKTLTPQTLFNTYLNPGKITIPQTNARIAYQLNLDTAIAVNLDHMKYVVLDGQSVHATGQLAEKTYPANGQQFLTPTFMHYEHTDGLNVVTFELEKKFPLNVAMGDLKARAFALMGAGIVIPKSNITMTMLGQARNDKFHLAGTNLNVAGGLEIDLSKVYFSRLTYKIGSVNLNDVITSSRQDKASQRINYREASFTVGMHF